MRSLIRAAAVALLCLVLSGCGTFLGRVRDVGWVYEDDYYRSTQASVKFLTFGGGPGTDGFPALFCWISAVCPVLMLYSLPLDFATDTVLLPVDAYRDWRHAKSRRAEHEKRATPNAAADAANAREDTGAE